MCMPVSWEADTARRASLSICVKATRDTNRHFLCTQSPSNEYASPRSPPPLLYRGYDYIGRPQGGGDDFFLNRGRRPEGGRAREAARAILGPRAEGAWEKAGQRLPAAAPVVTWVEGYQAAAPSSRSGPWTQRSLEGLLRSNRSASMARLQCSSTGR